MSRLEKFDIWITDMSPGKGTEPGKIRPVVIIQSNILNKLGHFSTIVCPISSQKRDVTTLRIPVKASKKNGLKNESSVLVDQVTAIDLSLLIEKIGFLEEGYHTNIQETLALLLDLES